MENNLVLGLDQSFTSTGCVLINSNNEIVFVNTLTSDKSMDFFDRAWFISQEINKIVVAYNPQLIYMEDLAFGSSGNATRQLSGLQYVIVTNLRNQLNVSCSLVPPTTLKKWATGKGNSKKDVMYEVLPENVKSLLKEKNIKKTKGLFDVTDAYWLANYGINKHAN